MDTFHRAEGGGMSGLAAFVKESNKIEGIIRDPSQAELSAHTHLLACENLTIAELELFVKLIAPGKPLRRVAGLDVRVGNHIAPRGGPEIETHLQAILHSANAGADLYWVHHQYETLHPFCDGNGRSGRAIWLWQMQQANALASAFNLGFLHAWYYQTLSRSQFRQEPTP